MSTTFTVANQSDIGLISTAVAAAGTSAYTAQTPGLYVLTGVSQAMTFTLPAAGQMLAGQTVTVKRGDASRFAINVLPQSVAQIDVAASAAIANAFGFLELQWDGSNWWIVGKG